VNVELTLVITDVTFQLSDGTRRDCCWTKPRVDERAVRLQQERWRHDRFSDVISAGACYI